MRIVQEPPYGGVMSLFEKAFRFKIVCSFLKPKGGNTAVLNPIVVVFTRSTEVNFELALLQKIFHLFN